MWNFDNWTWFAPARPLSVEAAATHAEEQEHADKLQYEFRSVANSNHPD